MSMSQSEENRSLFVDDVLIYEALNVIQALMDLSLFRSKGKALLPSQAYGNTNGLSKSITFALAYSTHVEFKRKSAKDDSEEFANFYNNETSMGIEFGNVYTENGVQHAVKSLKEREKMDFAAQIKGVQESVFFSINTSNDNIYSSPLFNAIAAQTIDKIYSRFPGDAGRDIHEKFKIRVMFMFLNALYFIPQFTLYSGVGYTDQLQENNFTSQDYTSKFVFNIGDHLLTFAQDLLDAFLDVFLDMGEDEWNGTFDFEAVSLVASAQLHILIMTQLTNFCGEAERDRRVIVPHAPNEKTDIPYTIADISALDNNRIEFFGPNIKLPDVEGVKPYEHSFEELHKLILRKSEFKPASDDEWFKEHTDLILKRYADTIMIAAISQCIFDPKKVVQDIDGKEKELYSIRTGYNFNLGDDDDDTDSNSVELDQGSNYAPSTPISNTQFPIANPPQQGQHYNGSPNSTPTASWSSTHSKNGNVSHPSTPLVSSMQSTQPKSKGSSNAVSIGARPVHKGARRKIPGVLQLKNQLEPFHLAMDPNFLQKRDGRYFTDIIKPAPAYSRILIANGVLGEFRNPLTMASVYSPS